MSEIAKILIEARGDDPETVADAVRERTRLELGLPKREELGKIETPRKKTNCARAAAG